MRHVIFDFFGTLVTYEEVVGGHRVERARSELARCGVDLEADAIAARFADASAALEQLAGTIERLDG